ncbi:MAG TPA: UbiD family decarboxylase [bacterium]|jgi:UbiD family decarboxylase|nr:UbiD family decarboxylase [bacterium]
MTLGEYLGLLESKGLLHRVKAEVDARFEIGEIAQRQVRMGGGPALLFENVKGSDFPLAINLNATPQRLRLGLGADPAELGNKLVGLLKAMQPPSLGALWRHRSALSRGLSMRVKRLGSSPVQDVVDLKPDLGRLPILHCWPQDAGRFITLPLVHTVSPLTGKGNLGMYRMQVHNASETGMHVQIVRGTEAHAQQAGPGAKLPCAVALGGDPALILSAIFPLPEDVEELPFAGLLRGKPQTLVRAKTQPLWVPADAEFILEGVIDLADRRMEGPFGDHFGHYSHAAPYPTFKLSAMTHRKNAVYPATVVGKPPQEDKVWGEAINAFSKPILKLMHPEIEDFWTFYEAGFHNLLSVAVKQRHAKEGVKTALGLLGQGQLSLCKVVALVDKDVDPKDFMAVLREAKKNFDPREDALLLPGTPLDTLDFTSYTMNLGSKLILDFTSSRGLTPDAPKRGAGAKPKAKDAVYKPDQVRRLAGPSYAGQLSWQDSLLVVKIRNAGRPGASLLAKLLKAPLGGHKIVALVSDDVDLTDPVSVLWGLFTRFDAARDIQFTRSSLRQAWPLHEGVLGIDATWKRGYPDPVEMPSEIVRRVDERWHEYGF